MSPREIYTAANLLMQRHGKEAAIFAAMRADSLAEDDDRDGERVWIRIIEAIHVLEQKAPADAEVVQ